MNRPTTLIRIAVCLVTCGAAVPASGQFPGQPPQASSPGLTQRPAGAPDWFPLAAEHSDYLDRILRFWEHTTTQTVRYRCVFKRWEYEPQLSTFSEGSIMYSAPDKGLFEVRSIKNKVGSSQPGAEPQWRDAPEGFREHWICDGKSIFEFDHLNKQLKQRMLPPEMQGQRITDGPLPFLFGAKADEIKSRFWMRVITPKHATGEFWLEALPKTQADAANFTKIHVILAEEDFLPKGMILFHRNQFQTTFAFENRETNWNILAQQLLPFINHFFNPRVPAGWKKVVEPMGGAPADQAAARQPRPGTRTR